MALGELPEDGELRLGGISLPEGRRVVAGFGSGGPVAWVTTAKVPDAARIWAALSDAHAETGLVPFLASPLDRSFPERPWDEGEFEDPADISSLDDMDVAEFLK